MAVTSNQSGSQVTTIGTEHTLGTAITAAGIYVLVVDTNAMANGDELELRVKTKVKSAATSRLAYLATYAHVQTAPNKYSIPVPIETEFVATLKQTAGSSRTFDWNILSL